MRCAEKSGCSLRCAFGGPEGLGKHAFLPSSSSLEPLLWVLTQGVFYQILKGDCDLPRLQPLLPDFRVFAPYSWDEFISIILWMGKLRPRECKITQCGETTISTRKTSFHPVPEWGQGEAHWVMPPSSPSSGPLTQRVSIHDAVLHLPIGA